MENTTACPILKKPVSIGNVGVYVLDTDPNPRLYEFIGIHPDGINGAFQEVSSKVYIAKFPITDFWPLIDKLP